MSVMLTVIVLTLAVEAFFIAIAPWLPWIGFSLIAAVFLRMIGMQRNRW
ncbi:MAG: hypothetical protein R2710_21800 [Acidimicrobiales bacterium]